MSDTTDTFGEAFDAVDWRLTLYENGTMDYDDTIRAIVTAVTQIADPVAAARRGVESGTIKGEVREAWWLNENPEIGEDVWALPVEKPGTYVVIGPVSDGGSETEDQLSDYHDYQRRNEAPTVYSDPTPSDGGSET